MTNQPITVSEAKAIINRLPLTPQSVLTPLPAAAGSGQLHIAQPAIRFPQKTIKLLLALVLAVAAFKLFLPNLL